LVAEKGAYSPVLVEALENMEKSETPLADSKAEIPSRAAIMPPTNPPTPAPTLEA
jgi:hypothetical protein